MKRALKVKQKALFIIFKGFPVVKNCLGPGRAPSNIDHTTEKNPFMMVFPADFNAKSKSFPINDTSNLKAQKLTF